METDIMEVRGAGDGAAAVEYVRPPSKRYSWAEVRQAVHDLRKELSCLSTMVPIAISFRKLGNGKTRIYFLRNPQNGWEITLLYTDVLPSQQPNNSRLDWKPLIESNVALGVTSGKWSREEQLLWERQRVAAWGIASYELHQATGRIMFPCASSLFVADEGLSQSPPLVPRSLNTGGGAPLTPAMCPRAPDLVAHAARGDIWLAGGQLRRPTRLTYACKGHEPDRLADDPRQAGVPCYVTQEEFSRYTGFWWQPQAEDDVFRIVLQKAAPTTVLDYYQEGAAEHSGESTNGCMEVTDIRWYELRQPLKETFPWFEYLARVGWTPCGQYVWVQLLDRKQQRLELVLIPLSQFCTPSRYDTDDAPTVRHETVISDQFCTPSRYDSDDAPTVRHEPVISDQAIQDIQILVSETAPDAWINVHDILYFLPSNGLEMNFIWASEESGHLHLYLVTCALIQKSTAQNRSVIEMITEDESNAVGPNMISKEPITAGEWEVMARKIWVDVGRQLVYFVGLRETPLERHLYAAPLAPPRPHAVTLLTSVGHSCAVDIDEDCTMAVITSSNISSVPVTRVYRITTSPPRLLVQGTITDRPPSGCIYIDCTMAVITSSNISSVPVTRVYRITTSPPRLLVQGTITDRPPSESLEIRSFNGSWDSRSGDGDDTDSETGSLIRERSLSISEIPAPTIYETRLSCGATAYCTLWRCGRPGRSPTVLHVYGGPEVQTVTNSYKGIRQLRMHMLAARGFNVVAVDSRGSKHRGRAWEAAIKGKLGQIELDDQVEVLQWLAKETGCIDMERVAIHGWSYGGYLSLLALATRPAVFRVCVAGAPVTCWRLYDTAYTERYMGSPARSPHAYTRASVLAHAPFFPDQKRREMDKFNYIR
ncbi:hypothetical protein B5X24_HaOG211225 [Helicoverpa armigera]|uniref:Dipeptidyl peptidase 9 n=1 Tax=Helicoverpa armigera TaxID=29058 RepID=A0A2W1BBS9_HELAM|nr:hypothetical protein B5X24_HaOG211225 [Helicoverpa armigera]